MNRRMSGFMLRLFPRAAAARAIYVSGAVLLCCVFGLWALLRARHRLADPATHAAALQKAAEREADLNEAFRKGFMEAITAPPEYKAKALEIMMREVSQFVDD